MTRAFQVRDKTETFSLARMKYFSHRSLVSIARNRIGSFWIASEFSRPFFSCKCSQKHWSKTTDDSWNGENLYVYAHS